MTFRFFLLFFIQFWWDIVRRHFWPVERLPSKWSPGRRWCWSQGKDQRGRQERRQTPPDPSRCFSPFLKISDFVKKKFYQRTTHSNTHPLRFPGQRRCWVLRSLPPKHCRWPSAKIFVSRSFALFSTNLCSLYLHQGVCVPLSFSRGGNFLDVSWNFAGWVVDFLHLQRKYVPICRKIHLHLVDPKLWHGGAFSQGAKGAQVQVSWVARSASNRVLMLLEKDQSDLIELEVGAYSYSVASHSGRHLQELLPTEVIALVKFAVLVVLWS